MPSEPAFYQRSQNDLKNPWTDLRNVLILTCLIALSFLPILNAKFLYWDDNRHVFENPLVQATDTVSPVKIFQNTVNKTYIPLTILSFHLEHRLFAFNPFFYHLDNLLLHILVSIAIYVLIRRMKFGESIAFMTALLFGIHPMHVESVAWVTQRKDVLYSLFYLLSLWHYVGYVQRNKKASYVWALVFGSLSILAKPMALSLPLVLFLFDWFLKRSWNRKLLLEKIPFALIIFSIAWLTYSLNRAALVSPPGEALLIWTWSFSFYLEKFIFPFHLIPLYILPQPVSLFNFQYAAAVLTVTAFIGGTIYFRKNRLIVFAALYFFLSIFFILRVSDVTKNLGPSIVADRFMYLPSLGICLLLAQVAIEHKRKWVHYIISAILAFCWVKTFEQCQIWKDDITLWNYVIGHGQEAPVGYNSRGVAFVAVNDFDRALLDFNRSLQLKPTYDLAYYNRGKLYIILHEDDKALEDFNACVKANPKHLKVFSERGILYSRHGRLEEALKDFDTALELNPADAKAYNNRGIVYKKMGRWDAALANYDAALKLNPRSVQTYANRADIYKKQKRYNDALKDLRRAQELGLAVDPVYLKEIEALTH